MADRKFSMDDYIDVAERIDLFIEKFPEGSLQTIGWDVREVAGQTFIVYRAAAYRTPDDQRPGMGIAWEPFPGKTPYTRDSELMNAETASWGRAIVALGLTAKRKIASRQEVQARQGGETSASGEASEKQLVYLERLSKKHKPSDEVKRAMLAQVGGVEGVKLTGAQVSALIEMFKSGTLPTGQSDIPSDPPPVEDAPAGEVGVPWDDGVLPSKSEAQQMLDEAKGGA